ncbi:MAG: hypothetical protein U1E51_06495 [Candidatus Binatia bacterium]|nr:hypothetical protein [Hyphomicrobiales bacterium]MDZ4342073.1 hypothetical protein [Candidatus Binatia bacterium]
MGIVDWIIDNRAWVFSGVGVAIIGGFIAFARWLLVKRKSEPVIQIQFVQDEAFQRQRSSTDVAEAPIERISSVTFAEIRAAMAAAPPLHRREVAKRYVGLHVEWDTYLYAHV